MRWEITKGQMRGWVIAKDKQEALEKAKRDPILNLEKGKIKIKKIS